MSLLRVLLACLALTFWSPAMADKFDDCTDKAWEDYSECSGKCGGRLGCQRKCVEQKNKDLKACQADDAKLRLGTTQFAASSADCVERYVVGNSLYLGLRCPEAHAITIDWYRNNGTLESRQKYNVARERKIQFRGGGLNELQVVSIEPMQSIAGGDAYTTIQSKVENGVLYFTNPTNKHIAITFSILYEGFTKSISQNNVVPPGKTLPAHSGTSPKWTHTLLGAQSEPD